jgi:CTP synthase (UTP-ammonia lyase)
LLKLIKNKIDEYKITNNAELFILIIKNNAFNENYRRHFKINKLLKNKMKRKEVKILGLSYSQDQMVRIYLYCPKEKVR